MFVETVSRLYKVSFTKRSTRLIFVALPLHPVDELLPSRCSNFPSRDIMQSIIHLQRGVMSFRAEGVVSYEVFLV